MDGVVKTSTLYLLLMTIAVTNENEVVKVVNPTVTVIQGKDLKAEIKWNVNMSEIKSLIEVICKYGDPATRLADGLQMTDRYRKFKIEDGQDDKQFQADEVKVGNTRTYIITVIDPKMELHDGLSFTLTVFLFRKLDGIFTVKTDSGALSVLGGPIISSDSWKPITEVKVGDLDKMFNILVSGNPEPRVIWLLDGVKQAGDKVNASASKHKYSFSLELTRLLLKCVVSECLTLLQLVGM